MRTSAQQFEQLVEFMERHGDLNKPADGPHGRIRAIQHWEDLTSLLNLDTSGDHKSIDKWKKVWSDFKNNTKRKAAKIQQAAANGVGGSASKQLSMSDLELRVLRITQAGAPPPIAEEYVIPSSEWSRPNQNMHLEKPFDTCSKSDEDIKLSHLVARSGNSTPVAWEMSVSPAASPAGAGRAPRRLRRSSALRRPARPTEDRLATILRVYTNETIRLRRRELEQQAKWQSLFGKLVDVLNKFLDK